MSKERNVVLVSVAVFLAGAFMAAFGLLALTGAEVQAAPPEAREVTNRILLYLPDTNNWHLVNTDDGTLVTSVDAFGPEASFNCDGSRFVVNDLTGAIRIYDSVSGQLLNQLYLGTDPSVVFETQLRDWSCAPNVTQNR